jgi:GntR family transcriptional regulator
MAFQIQIATGISTPIYRQIVDQISVAVASGTLEPGERMPSVRTIAENLIINPNTVARAYSDLVRDGVLSTQPGRGIFVGERRQRLSEMERGERLTKACDQFVNSVALLGYTNSELLQEIKDRLHALELAETK